MFKKAMLFLAALLLVSASAYAEGKFTVSGEVIFSGDEPIYVCLLSKEGFKNYKKKLTLQPFVSIIRPNNEQVKACLLYTSPSPRD